MTHGHREDEALYGRRFIISQVPARADRNTPTTHPSHTLKPQSQDTQRNHSLQTGLLIKQPTPSVYFSKRSKQRQALVPPNPKLLEITRFTLPSCLFWRMSMSLASSTRSSMFADCARKPFSIMSSLRETWRQTSGLKHDDGCDDPSSIMQRRMDPRPRPASRTCGSRALSRKRSL